MDYKESEEHYRAIVQSTTDWIWETDEQGKYCYCSQKIEGILGFTADEIIGKSPFDLMTQEEGERVGEIFQKIVETKSPIVDLENWNLHKDGHRVCLLTNGFPVFNENGTITGYRGADKDITKRKLAEEALREKEELYRTLVEKMPDGVYKSTPAGKFIEVNPAMVEILGYESKEELMDVDIKTQLYFEPSDRESKVLLEKLKGMEVYLMKKKDGSEVWVEDHGWYNTDENGEILFHEGILRDVTDRKKAETEIKLKNEELQKLNTEKDKFFSIIAHDLRSPFNGFLGLTEIMAEGLHSMTLDQIQNIAVNMKNSAANLYRLLGNLLEWSLMQRGLTIFKPASLLLSQKISETMLLILEAADKKDIKINYDIPEDLTVFADGNMLEGIIRNLCSNAVKFTPKGGKILISAKPLPDKRVEISVRDTGIGMDKYMIDNLFQLAIDTSREGTENESSTGLGLIICKDFVEKHGGKLRVESEEGKGTAFYFTIAGSS